MDESKTSSHSNITGQTTATVGSSSEGGQKVTTTRQTQSDPKNENPGIVTSDSLAAESIQEGGSFAATSDSRGPMSQPSRSSNAATTDISNATRLDPAPDAEARLASEEWNEASKLQSNLGNSSSPSSSAGTSAILAGTNLGSSASGGPTGAAPTYTAAAASTGGSSGSTGTTSAAGVTDTTNQQPMPKGKNITEGGFDPDAPNASNNTDIGSKRDPGRAAVQGFAADNVPSAGGAGPRQGEVTNDGQYDVLKETSA